MKSNTSRDWMLLELLAYWGGSITADQFARVLGGVRRETAQEKLTEFKRNYPGTLVYNASNKCTMYRGDAESLRFCPSDPDLLLTWLAGERIAQEATGESTDGHAISLRAGTPLAVDVVDVSRLVPHHINPDVLRAVIDAISHRRSLRLDYVSKTRTTEVWFSPHTIVWASGRHHARGFAIFPETPIGEQRSYNDIVLGRIRAAEVAKTGAYTDYVGPEQDTNWNSRIDLTFTFASDLDEARRVALRLDHGLLKGTNQLRISNVPAALKRYIVREVLGRRIEGQSDPLWTPTS